MRNYVRGPHLLVIFILTCLFQFEWRTSPPWTPTTAGSETLTRSDFLGDSKSQLVSDHYGLEKAKPHLMEYLAVVRLHASIAQEAEVEHAKAQEVALKKAIDKPAANASEPAFIKVGEISAPPQLSVPVSPQSQSLSRAKAVVGPPGTRKTSLGRSIARALGRPFQRIASLLVGCATRLGYGVTVGLTLLADLDNLRRRCARPVVWIPVCYCEHLLCLLEFADSIIAMTTEMKSRRSVNQITTVTHPWRCPQPKVKCGFQRTFLHTLLEIFLLIYMIITPRSDRSVTDLVLLHSTPSHRCSSIGVRSFSYLGTLMRSCIYATVPLPKQLRQNRLSEAHVQLTEPALLQTVAHYTQEAGLHSLECAIGGIVR